MSDKIEIEIDMPMETMLSPDKININVNAENKVINIGTTISEFLSDMDVKGRFLVVVNDEIIPKSAHENTQLNPSDSVDIMSPISGG
jgi:thiamine biosynthesis protein ThiS